MRVNVYVASATGLSRRAADDVIKGGQVTINGQQAAAGDQVSSTDIVVFKGEQLSTPDIPQTILLNKPIGYVCSRDGQGSKTVYDLLPPELNKLKPVGRLDKDSSGLLLLTNDGKLAHQLTHPSFNKQKIYIVSLNKMLEMPDKKQIEAGVMLEDGVSQLQLDGRDNHWTVTMTEGRNRQIRRTFEVLGYRVIKLHRKQFGDYKIGAITEGKYLLIE